MDELIKNDGVPGDAPQQVLLMTLSGRNFFIGLSEVVHILSLKRSLIFDVPFDVNGRIRGIFSYKGKVVAIARASGMPCAADADGAQTLTAVILSDEGRLFAMLADKAQIAGADEIPANSLYVSAKALYSGELTHDDK